jgi:NitT/TauT family transport system substrate-binding protein
MYSIMIAMNRKLILIVVAIIAIVAVGAIAGTMLSKPSQTTMKIGYLPAASYGLLWIAQEKGYFTEQGINVTLKEYPNVAQLVTALGIGEIDGAAVTSVAIAAFVKNLDISIVGGNSLDGTALATRNGTGIQNLGDLSGLTLATVQYVPGDFVFKKVIADESIDVTLKEFLTPSDALTALENGNASAALLWEPYASLAESRNLTLPIWDKDVYSTDYPCCLQAFSNTYLKANPTAATKFIKALVKAEALAINNAGESLPMVKGYLEDIPTAIIIKSIFYNDPDLGRTRNPLSAYFNKTELQQFYVLLIGTLLTQNDYNTLIGKLDDTYYSKALSELRGEGFVLPARYS